MSGCSWKIRKTWIEKERVAIKMTFLNRVNVMHNKKDKHI